MSCKGIRLVFSKGSCIVKIPNIADSHDRIGSVLAALDGCAPGTDGFHKVPVKEIPTPALGAPLKLFLAEGKLPPSSTLGDASLLLAPSYKAAERLDIAAMGRAPPSRKTVLDSVKVIELPAVQGARRQAHHMPRCHRAAREVCGVGNALAAPRASYNLIHSIGDRRTRHHPPKHAGLMATLWGQTSFLVLLRLSVLGRLRVIG